MATATKLEDAALAGAGDVPTGPAVVHAVEQETAEPTVAPASSETAPVASKRAAKKAKKTEKPVEPEGDVDTALAATVDHPYLSFLHKRIRLYKKKLEKIRALETARANEGKVLNDQQLEVVGNKALVEKMIAEFESLREQFIEVYVKEEAEKNAKQAEEAKKEEEIKPVVILESVAKQEEAPVSAEKKAAPLTVELPRDAFAYVEDLLRTLHAVTLHQALGKDVPPVLDYFSKVVLGTTRPPAEVPFDENLAESLEEATRYLTKSEKIVALEYTYKDLRAMVEKLGALASSTMAESTPEATDEEVAAAEESTAVHAPAAEELPHINFFTESQLEVIAAEGMAVEVETEDKDNQHEEMPEAIEPTVSEEEAPEDSPVEEEAASVSAPPKSLAAAATNASTGKSVWSRKPKSVTSARNDSSDEKSNQRRRSQGRSKSNNNSNSPRNGDGKNLSGSDGVADGSNNNNNNKPRRPRPQRSNDENSGSYNTNRVNKAAGKAEDRRPRPERPMRKQQPAQPQQYREAA